MKCGAHCECGRFQPGDIVRHAPSGLAGVVCGLRESEVEWTRNGVVYVTVFGDMTHVRR
jgi:hypothetical protein